MTSELLSAEDLKTSVRELGVVDDAQILSAEELSQREKISLYEAFVRLDLISDENLGQLVADKVNFPFVNLSKTSIDHEVLEIIPEIVAKKQRMIAFERGPNGVKVAMANPTNKEPQQLLSKKIGEPLVIYYATNRDIDNVLHLYQRELQKSFDEMLKEQVDEAGNKKSQDIPVAKIVDLLISYAYQDKASDIHIEPEEEKSIIRFRIDGVLHDVLVFPKSLHDQVVTRIKILARLRTDEHMSAQDGKLQIPQENELLDVRVSIVPVVNGETVVLRLLSSRSRQFSLTELGLSDRDLEKVKNGFNNPHGMVLSTGPTGSGKTTTIYSILKLLNVREKNIATIEDPVEYDIQGLSQIQVNPKTNLTFADGLKSILRQDPDIIFVGEIRDNETSDIAINAALTGHLVLSTLHTNNAPTTIPRLIDMGIEPFLIASTVNVVVAQRLVRKICENCRVSVSSTSEELAKVLPKSEIKKLKKEDNEIRLYKGKGCPVCHGTGYNGRIGIFEVLEITPTIRELIVQKADSDVIMKQAVKEKMTTMFDDGVDKVLQGLTTVEEVIRITKT